MYLYRATKDPSLLYIGVDILEAIEHSTKTKCGYATVSFKILINMYVYSLCLFFFIYLLKAKFRKKFKQILS